MSKAESIWRDASIAVAVKPHDWTYNLETARQARAESRKRARINRRIALLRARLALLGAS